jgi:hypothetical protein
MPHRPSKKTTSLHGRSRPQWNTEPDYWLREKERLNLIESIRKEADRFIELDQLCPCCDTRPWEANRGQTRYRGCHCATLKLLPGHKLYNFDRILWERTIRAVVQLST